MSACVSRGGPVWRFLAFHLVTAEILVSLIKKKCCFAESGYFKVQPEEAVDGNASVPEEMSPEAKNQNEVSMLQGQESNVALELWIISVTPDLCPLPDHHDVLCEKYPQLTDPILSLVVSPSAEPPPG